MYVTVSYTHLDVYKRQKQWRVVGKTFGEADLYPVPYFSFKKIVESQFTVKINVCIMVAYLLICVPVSRQYTDYDLILCVKSSIKYNILTF